MKKSLLILLLIISLIGISSKISLAENANTHITSTPERFDHGMFQLERFKSDTPITNIGLINNHLLVSFSATEHAWLFNNAFTPVNGDSPAKALGYTTLQTAETFLGVPKTSPCSKFKDAIGAISINTTKTLCLSSSAGGDFTLHRLPAIKDNLLSIGYGKHPLLEKAKVSWVGYDGNLYVAYVSPSYFADPVTAIKEKTSPTVFLLKNGVRYSIPDEKTFYTWFDSFKSVSVIDAKKLASYPLVGKATYKQNTLVQFPNDPKLYSFIPPNSPYDIYGKDVKIQEEKSDRWILQDPKKKNATIELMKRTPQFIPLSTELSQQTRLFEIFGTDRFIKLDSSVTTKTPLSEKTFDPKTDVLYE